MESDVPMRGGSNNNRGSGGRGRGRGRGDRGGARRGLKNATTSALVGRFTTRGSRGGRQRGGRGGSVRPGSKREDADGDLQMGEEKEKPENPRKWRANRDAFAASTPASSVVVVTGFDLNESTQNVCNFLLQKSGAPIQLNKQYVEGTKLYIETGDSSQAFALTRLNRIRYSGQPLFIRYAPSTQPATARAGLVGLLEPFIASHYDVTNKYLNLAELGGKTVDQIVFDFNRDNFMKAVFMAISKKAADVVSINFSNNQIRTLRPFTHMQSFNLSSVENISFAGNDIANFDDLDNLKGLKIRELALANNPITSGVEAQYQGEVRKRFDTIKFLDGKSVEQAGIQPTVSSVGTAVPTGNRYDTPQTQQLVESFLQKYFQCFDGDRSILIDVYTETSTFTLTSSLLSNSMNGQQTGRVNIVHFLGTFPPTKHQFEGISIEAHLASDASNQQLLYITIHGHFLEAASQTNRSYDRNLVLAPAAPDSPAAARGWPAVIISDQFHIREYMSQPTILGAQPQVVTPFQPVQQMPPASKSEILNKFLLVSKLKEEFAIMLLDQCQWQYDKAVMTFISAKEQGQIQPHMLLP